MSKGRELVERLAVLPPQRFNQLAVELGFAPGVLSAESAPQPQRAMELVRYFQQPGRDTSSLESVLDALHQATPESVPFAPPTSRPDPTAAPRGVLTRRAIVLAALPLEYKAVRAHLRDLREETHPLGSIYERGFFETEDGTWEVLIVESGEGNAGTAIGAERALTWFPQAGEEGASVAPDAAASKELLKERTPRVNWAELLRRTFDLDVFVRVRCGGRRRVLAEVKGGGGVRAIREHLGLPPAGVSLAPAQESTQAVGC